MSAISTSSSAFFEAKYSREADPWNFANDAYELARYDAILASLTSAQPRYARAFEPGCSVGVLTERLAALCDTVVAIDFSPTAIEQARRRCAHLPNVSLRCQPFPDSRPIAGFDLIVLSEIGYYFTPADWRSLTAALIAPMQSGATLLAAHWLGSSPDHRMSGDEVHSILHANPNLQLAESSRHEGFRLDRWMRL